MSNKRTLGTDLMNRINEGMLNKEAPQEHIEGVKNAVTDAFEEILDVGARIRPLIVDNRQIGWARSLYSTEHKKLRRWIYDNNEFMVQCFMLGTTLTREEIEDLSATELHSLGRTLQTMKEYDLSLLPYISAFVSTLTSEHLWHGKGTRLTSYENREVKLPDGKVMRLVAPSDHARLWATLCTYREQSKLRVDNSLNALMIVRPMAGKSADPVANDLRVAARMLQPDSYEPWKLVVKPEFTAPVDGWGHQDDTLEGLQRQLDGMVNNDKHERFIQLMEQLHQEEAEKNKIRVDEIVSQRGGPGVWEPEENSMLITSPEDDRKLHSQLVRGVSNENREIIPNAADQLRRYSDR